MSKRNNFYGSFSSFTYTARTIAFLTFIGIPNDGTVFFIGTPQQITGSAIWTAVNNFDLGLISYGLDSLLKALYLYIGGTATTHKINFMNPVDSDAAYRLTFAGGGTHSGTGWQTGINAYADTHLKPDPVLSLNSTSLSFYSRTNANNQYDMGCGITGIHRCELPARYGDLFYLLVNQSLIGSVANTDTRGLLSVSRTASNLTTACRNGASLGSSANASAIRPNINMVLGAYNFNGGIIEYSSKEYCMHKISDGFTLTDESNFYTITQALQTALFRQV